MVDLNIYKLIPNTRFIEAFCHQVDTYNIFVKIFAPPIPPSPRPGHVRVIFVAGAQSENVSSPDVAGSEQRRHVPRVLPLPASAEMLTNSHTIRPCPLINDPPNIITDGEMRNTRLKCKVNPYNFPDYIYKSTWYLGDIYIYLQSTVSAALSALSNNSDVTA